MNNFEDSVQMEKTELGKIPKDWRSLPLAEVCNLINGRGFKPYEWVREGLPIIRIQNLNGSEEFNYFDGHYAPKIEVNKGQLLFAWSGSRGTSFGPHIWYGQKALLNYHTWKVVITTSDLVPDYFYFALKALTKIIEESAHGASALVHTQMGEMKKFVLPIPQSLEEQSAIANALSDIDALVTELEKLIAKKQAIKTATMQQLLTGRTRLPEFARHPDGTLKGYKQTELGEIPEDWEIKSLSQLATVKSGGTPSTNNKKFWDGDVNWCTPTDITALDGKKYLSSTTRKITEAGVTKSAADLLPVGTVVMTSRATIGECAVATVEMTTNQGFKNFICGSELDNEFLFYLLGSLKERFIGLCSGSTFLEISTSQVRNFSVVIPCKKEQIAIATFLSDMDEEIQLLQQRLNKTRQIKQGMMQELLTGKTRLIQPVQVAAKTTTETKPTQAHNWAFNEAVVISVLANKFGSEKFPLGRMRYTKLSYLLHRHAEKQAEGYLKKAAGPYNPKTRYAGPESIALNNGYIRQHQSGKFSGFIAAENIEQAEGYFKKWYSAEAIQWLEQFRYKSNDELELFATVDMAAEELLGTGKPVDTENVRILIRETPEWKPKLMRSAFSDDNIGNAISEVQTLFGCG